MAPARIDGHEAQQPGPLLAPSQELVLEAVAERRHAWFERTDYEAISRVSRAQASREVSDLLARGLIERVGGRSAAYRLVRTASGEAPAGARPSGDDQRPGADATLAALGALFVLVFAALVAVVLQAVPAAETFRGQAFVAGDDPALRPAAPVARETRQARPPGVRLRLTAGPGGSLLAVRRGPAGGALLWEGTLARGESLRLGGRRLWIELGAAGGVEARLNGKRIEIPAEARLVRVSPAGIRVVERSEPAILAGAAGTPPTSTPAPTSPAITATARPPAQPARPAPDPVPSGRSQPSPDLPGKP